MANHAILVILVILAAMANRIMAYRPDLPSSWPSVPTEALEPHDRAHLQFSPRPTDSSVVNDNFRALHNKRDGSSSLSIGTDTCGWWTDIGLPMACGAGWTCTNSGTYRDCCLGGNCQASVFNTVCLDATAKACSNPGVGTRCCTGNADYPRCVTYLWQTSTIPNVIFTLFNCDQKANAGQEILSPTPVFISTGATTTPTSTPSSTPTPSVPADTGNKNSGSGTPVGAIVGGVIGGLAVVGLVIVAVVFLVLRSRKQQAAKREENGTGNEAAPLSPDMGTAAVASHKMAAEPITKVEETVTPLSGTTAQGTHASPDGTQYESAQRYENLLYPAAGSSIQASDADIQMKRLSELGDNKSAELPT